MDIRFPGDGVTGDYEPPGMDGTNWAQAPCKPALKAEPPLQLSLHFLGCMVLATLRAWGHKSWFCFVSVGAKAPKGLLSELGDGFSVLEDFGLWTPFHSHTWATVVPVSMFLVYVGILLLNSIYVTHVGCSYEACLLLIFVD